MDIGFFQSLDFGVVLQYLPPLLRGLAVNIALTLLSFLGGGIVLGGFLALASMSEFRAIRFVAIAFIEFWRSTPLLVQAIWVHFALPQLTGIVSSPFQSALLALTLNVAAYCAEIIRAGIQGVERGQFEAAEALGLPLWVRWVKVIFPQALRLIIPPLANSIISVFKATAILSVISVDDLMRTAVRISSYTYQPIELYTAAALMFFVVGLAMTYLGYWLERHFARGRR